jgi:hypothetical protein
LGYESSPGETNSYKAKAADKLKVGVDETPGDKFKLGVDETPGDKLEVGVDKTPGMKAGDEKTPAGAIGAPDETPGCP